VGAGFECVAAGVWTKKDAAPLPSRRVELMQARLACDVCISACDQRGTILGGRGRQDVSGKGEEAMDVEASDEKVVCNKRVIGVAVLGVGEGCNDIISDAHTGDRHAGTQR